MLKHLHIENYALIESLDIDLHKGFSVITGETGAGKSILLGAIGLLMGERADTSAIQTGKSRCMIEAEFDLTGYGLENIFEEADLEYDEKECIIRRELTSTGKSRAFVNDTPVTVSTLKSLGGKLVDIHSQHQNLLLNNEGFQLNVLDTLIEDDALLSEYNTSFKAWTTAVRAFDNAQNAARESKDDEDYLRFQLKELEDFDPKDSEDETLKTECDTLEHAEEIKQTLYTANGILNGEENATLSMIRQTRQLLDSIADVFPNAGDLSERMESCEIELKDIARECESQSEETECDEERLAEVRERLNRLYTLEQKHHVNSSGELLQILEDISARLNTIDNSDEHLEKLKTAVDEARKKLNQLAAKLTKAREKIAKVIEKEMVDSLRQLGMPNVQFSVNITPSGEPGPNGYDRAQFMFSANKNSVLQNIQNVASGGEIARVMLSLKALLSSAADMPTIIFDEIDTGVSGHIAESMASTMQKMGDSGRQVLSITHLPQIAAMGAHHYRVWKEDTKMSTLSHIRELSQDERIDELAHMLSGANVSEAAINNAKQLLGIRS